MFKTSFFWFFKTLKSLKFIQIFLNLTKSGHILTVIVMVEICSVICSQASHSPLQARYQSDGRPVQGPNPNRTLPLEFKKRKTVAIILKLGSFQTALSIYYCNLTAQPHLPTSHLIPFFLNEI